MHRRYKNGEIAKLEDKAKKDFQDILDQMMDEVVAVINLDDRLVKAKGQQRANHKYIQRTGSPGNYTYLYPGDGTGKPPRIENDYMKQVKKQEKLVRDSRERGQFKHGPIFDKLKEMFPGTIPKESKYHQMMVDYIEQFRKQDWGEDDHLVHREARRLYERFIENKGSMKTVVAQTKQDITMGSGGKNFAQLAKDATKKKLEEGIELSEAKPSTVKYKSQYNTGLVKGTKFGRADKETQQRLNDSLNTLEKMFDSIGMKFNTGITFFCGDLTKEDARLGGRFHFGGDRNNSIEVVAKERANKVLSHEIFHSIDNMFSRNPDKFASDYKKMPKGLLNSYDQIKDTVKNSPFYKKSEKAALAEKEHNEKLAAAEQKMGVKKDESEKHKSQVRQDHHNYLTDPTEMFARAGEIYVHGKIVEMMESGELDKKQGEEFLSTFSPDLHKGYESKYAGWDESKLVAHRHRLEDKMIEMDINGQDSSAIERELVEMDRAQKYERYDGLDDNTKKAIYESIKPHMEYILQNDTIKKALEELGVLRKSNLQLSLIRKIIKKHFLRMVAFTLGAKSLSKTDKEFLRDNGEAIRQLPEESIFTMAYQNAKKDNMATYEDTAKSFLKDLKRGIEGKIVDTIKTKTSKKEVAQELTKLVSRAKNSYETITVNELTMANNQGIIDGIVERSEEKPEDILVYCIGPLDDATSKECKHHYHANGSYKVYRLSDLLQNGSNAYKPRDTWKAVVPPMHPRCRHTLVELPKGWSLDDSGKAFFVGPKHHELDNNLMKKSLKGKVPTFSGWRLHGRKKFQGMDISIENRKGSYRKWFDVAKQEEGKTKMLYDYGYIRNTLGADGDHIDCYVGPNEDSRRVYVVHQLRADNGKFDEDKVMLGFDNAKDAKEAYLAHYNSKKFFGSMDCYDIDAFKEKALGKEHKGMFKGLPKGQQAANHKYIKRTGSPGNYQYWYQDPKTGELYTTDDEGHSIRGGEFFNHPDSDMTLPVNASHRPGAPSKTIVVKRNDGTGTMPLDETAPIDMEQGMESGEAQLAQLVHGDYAPQEANAFNTDLAAIGEQAYQSFITGEGFENIDSGVMGKKGFVTIGDKKYFVKSEKGGQRELASEYSRIGIQVDGRMNSNLNEIDYYNAMSAGFPHLQHYFVNKYQLNDNMYVADLYKEDDMIVNSIDKWSDKSKILSALVKEEQTRADFIELAVVNFLLGNVDRHGENLSVNNEGQMILFDEGMAFSPHDKTIFNAQAPAYVRDSVFGEGDNIKISELKSALTPEAKESMMKYITDPTHKKEFVERWDYLEKSYEVAYDENDSVNAQRYFDELMSTFFEYKDDVPEERVKDSSFIPQGFEEEEL